MRRWLIVAGLAIGALFHAGAPVRAAEAVDLALVLAVDVSLSMDPDEQQLQRDGYVAAFRDQIIQGAMIGGRHRKVAITYVEWAGPTVQQVMVPWTIIRTIEDAEAVADRLAAAPISRHRLTSISAILEYSELLFAQVDFVSERRVIDVSGDGPNNSGPPVTLIRDRLVAKGIVINGLPIVLKSGGLNSSFDIENLPRYYESCVIGGPGSFLLSIRDRSEFASATRQKLLLEITGAEPDARVVRAAMPVGADDADCLVGERLWRRYFERLP